MILQCLLEQKDRVEVSKERGENWNTALVLRLERKKRLRKTIFVFKPSRIPWAALDCQQLEGSDPSAQRCGEATPGVLG